MKFRSTRTHADVVTFKDAVFQGLAPDGGLYVPEKFPSLSGDELSSFRGAPIEEIGSKILSLFIDDIPQTELMKIVAEGLSFPLPIRTVQERRILELFHGPTMAFKDVAAHVLPGIMEYYLRKNNRRTLIITATSGDTGGAVAHGFSEKDNISVVILFPKGRVSKLQREQLTHVGRNIYPIEVEGTFDDCQKMVKQAFTDSDFKKYNLTSANSINIGRLLPQLIYYASSWAKLREDNLTFVVPSGNMGNVTAGLYAKMIGIPIRKLIIACNSNDPVVKYYKTGMYEKQPAHKTLSTAMDIGHPSNFERILDAVKSDYGLFKEIFTAVRVTDEETKQVMQKVHKTYSYILDPHTAVAWKAADILKLDSPVIISTASPVKFAEEIKMSADITVPDQKPTYHQSQTVFSSGNSYSELKRIVEAVINR
ncbi:threonine synthase [Candidatus Roizmanbacteria bacterium]|nr:MAG: threonine synthase [Candidatus Roizmanbacteria bacterium]